MFRQIALVLLASTSSARLASADEENLMRAQLERRLRLLKAFDDANNSRMPCDRLAMIAQSVPASSVLSRVSFRGPGAWEFSLGKGSVVDAEAMTHSFYERGMCSSAVVSSDGGAVTARCTIPSTFIEGWLEAASKLHQPEEAERAVLARQLENARAAMPDEPQLERHAQHVRDLASKSLVSGLALNYGGVKSEEALDRLEFSVKGAAAFPLAWHFICQLESERRTRIDSFELGHPHVHNGDWFVDFSVSASTFRYRNEDSHKELHFQFEMAEHPKEQSEIQMDFSRNPFGLPSSLAPLARSWGANAAYVPMTARQSTANWTATQLPM